MTGTDSRACLEYYVHNCAGPCIGAVSKEEYREVIKHVILFLEGKHESIVRRLDDEMRQAAEALDFEKAALLRDQIQAVNTVVEGQRIATAVKGEQDVIAFDSDKTQTYVQVFFIRGGKLIGRESFTLTGTQYEEANYIMTSFVKQFYASSAYIPPALLLQHPVEDKAVIEHWLRSKRGSKFQIQVPSRGNKKQLVRTVFENARQGLEQLKIKQQAAPRALEAALAEIERELQLPKLPMRIEGYDVSNIQGVAAVGSMVVFDQGKSKPSHYRRFRIRTVSGTNDYAMLQEVLKRRFKRVSEATGTWAILPDLILIDGGKGQLNAALAVIREAGVKSVPIMSLAKENEEIFVPQRAAPIVLPRQSPGLQLLQRVRDEAHRFALGYHQKIHRRETFESSLNAIPGIGARRKRALLRQFGSVQAIQEASAEDLATANGMTKSLAKRIKQYV
jgi:excinuclease ABC subunit C